MCGVGAYCAQCDGVISFFPPCGSQGLNTCRQAWRGHLYSVSPGTFTLSPLPGLLSCCDKQPHTVDSFKCRHVTQLGPVTYLPTFLLFHDGTENSLIDGVSGCWSHEIQNIEMLGTRVPAKGGKTLSAGRVTWPLMRGTGRIWETVERCLIPLSLVLGVEPRTSLVLGQRCTTELIQLGPST